MVEWASGCKGRAVTKSGRKWRRRGGMVVVEEQEQRIYDQVENENASLADHLPVALPKLTWKLLLNNAILSHEPKGEKSKTATRCSCYVFPST
jgi:hypothetical protein